MTRQPIDAWTRRRLRETKGLIIRKHRSEDEWDVIDEQSGRVLHGSLDRSGLSDFLTGTSQYVDLTLGMERSERHLLLTCVRSVVRYRVAMEEAEAFLADCAEKFVWDAETIAKVHDLVDLEAMMDGVTR